MEHLQIEFAMAGLWVVFLRCVHWCSVLSWQAGRRLVPAVPVRSSIRILKNQVIQKCIAAGAPAFLVGTLTRYARSKTPSASTIRRAEISLDAGLALWSKRHYLEDAVRVCWTDSSEQAGHDWLFKGHKTWEHLTTTFIRLSYGFYG